MATEKDCLLLGLKGFSCVIKCFQTFIIWRLNQKIERNNSVRFLSRDARADVIKMANSQFSLLLYVTCVFLFAQVSCEVSVCVCVRAWWGSLHLSPLLQI